jgi:membrane-associated phospholipid phosphatase
LPSHDPAFSTTIAAGVNFTFGDDTQYPCTNSDTDVINDGYQSFPSGHASAAFNLSVYGAVYIMWTWHVRQPHHPRIASWGFWKKYRDDLVNVLAKYWMLLMISIAWGVSLSRVRDFQHATTDIVGGAFLGTLIALLFSLRAIPRFRRVLGPDTGRCAEVCGTPEPIVVGGTSRNGDHAV